jgi:hypothetical protein
LAAKHGHDILDRDDEQLVIELELDRNGVL